MAEAPWAPERQESKVGKHHGQDSRFSHVEAIARRERKLSGKQRSFLLALATSTKLTPVVDQDEASQEQGGRIAIWMIIHAPTQDLKLNYTRAPKKQKTE